MASSTGGPGVLFDTKNDLPSKTRAAMIELLNARLADAVELQTQARQAHWNVKGPSFIALHKLFDDVAEEAEEYVDLLAERVVQLGGLASGTTRTVAARTSLPAYPLDIVDGAAHVQALGNSMAAFGKSIRAAIDEAAQVNDAATADLFTEIARGIDKSLWFVDAHAQTNR